MDMYGGKSHSIPQKTIIVLSELGLLAISYLVLFGHLFEGMRAFGERPHVYRNIALFACNVVVFCRFLFTLFVFLKRRIPLEETISVPFAFALYLLGFPLMARGIEVPWSVAEVLGILLFCLGSLVNSGAELERHRFKQRPEGKGKLYTGGLFALSMHINYFGDLLWVCGLACITRNPYALLVPIFLFCFFYFFNIPKLDIYLKARYGEQFASYSRTTKRLIPFLL
ncbi:DUF1295 domain-containing protein [Sorangium sp. So ce281]|uniref:DUF1295 domain-containing protein n=1 Tax=unclassified Sorangium TaxID=2621164 RepID=UPI003F608F91